MLKIEIVKLYIQGKNIQEIKEALHCKSDKYINTCIADYNKLCNLVDDYNKGLKIIELMKRYQYNTDKAIYDAIHRYESYTETKIQYKYNSNIYIDTNMNILSHEDINNLNFHIIEENNDVYNFSIINSSWKAYFIGIMLTDGCIDKNNKISIASIDKEIIELFANKFNSIINVRTFSNNDLLIYKKYKQIKIASRQNLYMVYITYKSYNSNFITQLNRFGIHYDQSTNIDYPHLLPEEYQFLPYIMQGIIDGDGCILYIGRMFHISSMNKNLLIWCKLVFEKWFGMTNLHLYDVTGKKYSQPFYRLDTSIKENMKILKNSIYKNNIGLERKYKILQEKV